MQMPEIECEVRRFIVDRFLSGHSEELTSDETLLGSVIDSGGVLELVMFLQEHFAVTVSDDVVPENIVNIRQIVSYVHGKLKARAANG